MLHTILNKENGIVILQPHGAFIKNHHKEIEKLAFVTDSMAGGFAELISSHFVEASIKSFEYDQIGDAKSWISEN